ncbi:acyl-CoA carboxylase subunit beta [Corynebacterium hadale]|uniref:Acyl-CoA carboxylase subunit beta n=2 Tax=Corynebacterium TaxID=1716 RepID=A0ABX4H771_9CORY|nr:MULTISPECIES: carboxyl transferase domain-containing protein [Corynebacterium]PAT04513.1 acyl-CoA carboxylase subunit beta [Corynebacterium sp. NML 150383]PAT05068.1 acyl-CoA carboxylase subunit beta [Corynebacterium hadale]RMD20796.1 acyl-CoA carboxylase subunit beta [Corynebacterium gottingense]WJZ12467.1 putative propionyl-CoA carboxylase beta chain 5 [Corynebacterium gottingense]WJZ14786.1 putative propionyl-CoA carboxylase beta chain 5 [Corynebacterium gottingense]
MGDKTAKPDLKTTAGRIQDLRNRLDEARTPAADRAEAPTEGAMTARARVEALLDDGSFVETDALARHRVEAYKMDRTKPATDGVITGYGLIDGRRVCIFSQDPDIFDGAIGEVYAEKMLKLFDLATKTGVPVIGIYDSVGPRWQEGIVTAHMQAKLLRAATHASGLVPQIALVAGEVATLAATTVPLADVTVMVEGASLHLSDTGIVSQVSGTATTADALGGASVHAATTGLAHVAAADMAGALDAVKRIVSYLPLNNLAASPLGADAERATAEGTEGADTDLDTIIPDDDAQPYEVAEIVAAVTDGDFYELGADFAGNVLTGFAHIHGRAVGVVATQPSVLAGCLTEAGARKAARFIRTCDAFNLPIVQFVDSPGFVPSTEEEHAGAPAGAAALAYAFAEAQVGTITVVTRKALGTAYTVLGSKGLGADLVFAWPTAQIALADAPTAAGHLNVDAEKYAEENLNPYAATERGLVDAVIPPSATRRHVLEGLRLLERKVAYPAQKKHGNIPL